MYLPAGLAESTFRIMHIRAIAVFFDFKFKQQS